MEKEIDELKNIYLMANAPQELIDSGFGDVLERINDSKVPFYTSRVFLSAFAIIILLFIGGIAIILKPNSINTVENATQNFVSGFVKSKPQKIDSVIYSSPVIKKPTLTPTNSPTPTTAPKNPNKGFESSSSNKGGESNNLQEEVKGISTQNITNSGPNANSNNNSGQKEEDSTNNNSNSNSHENNSSHSNQNSENHGNH